MQQAYTKQQFQAGNKIVLQVLDYWSHTLQYALVCPTEEK